MVVEEGPMRILLPQYIRGDRVVQVVVVLNPLLQAAVATGLLHQTLLLVELKAIMVGQLRSQQLLVVVQVVVPRYLQVVH
jgi:hypothetical protein